MQDIIHRFEPLWGTWHIDQLLGEGSYGRVWQIHREENSEIYYSAVKEMLIPASINNLEMARLEGLDVDGAKLYFKEVLNSSLDEVKLMQDLSSCENIVRFEEYQIHELAGTEEFGWIILIRMEKLKPFSKYLLEDGMTVKDVARLGIHICNALEICEKYGVVHRDIKPDNLFYCPETGIFKLGDFGIAHYLARPTEGKGKAGTLSHMPPEVFQGASFTPAADLYALGMILYRLLNDNRIPLLPAYPLAFTPQQRDKALVKRLQGENVEFPNVPTLENQGICVRVNEDTVEMAKDLGGIAQKAIHAKQEYRYASPTELRENIEKILKDYVKEKD